MRKGFTLIELMIVIAIIAVIAAIAIPGLLAAQRSSNERNASTSLKTITTAQADFRSNDRDGNRTMDFWTLDVYALFGMVGMIMTGVFAKDVGLASGQLQTFVVHCGALVFVAAFSFGGNTG